MCPCRHLNIVLEKHGRSVDLWTLCMVVMIKLLHFNPRINCLCACDIFPDMFLQIQDNENARGCSTCAIKFDWFKHNYKIMP